MIDNEGYRSNVGIIICNTHGQVMWARRYGQYSWQFPQGGINEGESPEQAMYRELFEEVGLLPKQVKIIAVSRFWLRYKLPAKLIRHDNLPLCIGQKQKWFLLQLNAPDEAIDLAASGHPEFDHWRWVSYWYPIRQVVSFKRDVYRRIMHEFSSVIMNTAPIKKNKKKSEGHSRAPQFSKRIKQL